MGQSRFSLTLIWFKVMWKQIRLIATRERVAFTIFLVDLISITREKEQQQQGNVRANAWNQNPVK